MIAYEPVLGFRCDSLLSKPSYPVAMTDLVAVFLPVKVMEDTWGTDRSRPIVVTDCYVKP